MGILLKNIYETMLYPEKTSEQSELDSGSPKVLAPFTNRGYF